jgi:hypothetical protein
VILAAKEMGTSQTGLRQLRRKKADAVGYILPATTPLCRPILSEFIAGLGDEQPFIRLI